MKTLQIITLLLCINFLISCSSDDDASNNNQQTLLAKSVTSSQTTTYVYDDNNRVISNEVIASNPLNNYSTIYTYNGSGQLAEVFYDSESSTEDIKSVYFYNESGQTTKIENYLVSSGISTLDSKSEAIYDTPGKVSVYETPNGSTPYLSVEYFLDANGNVIEQLAYDTAGFLIVTTENSDFDDKHSPSLSITKTGFVKNVNNYGTVTVTATGGVPSTGTFTYEYNSDGYPTKRTSNTGSIFTYEYIKR